MKKKVFLSIVGVVCFGFLFSYNATQSDDGVMIDNINALAQTEEGDEGFLCCNDIVNCCDYGDFEIDGEFVD